MPFLKCSVWVPLALCLCYHFDPWGCFFPFLFAVGIHELGHMVGIWAVGGRIRALELRLRGAVLEASPLTYGQELLCTLAGPLSGLLFGFLLGKRYPWIYFWTVLHSAYNLLPVYPLDGGRAFRAGLCLVFPLHKAEKIAKILERLTFLAVLLLSLLWLPKLLPFPYAVLPPLLFFLQTGSLFRE